jgi:hypothetical protein
VGYQDQVLWSARNKLEAAPAFRKLRGWDGISAEFTNVSGASQLGYRVETKAIYLALHDIVRFEGFARSTRKDIRKTLAFSPNRCRIEGWADFKQRRSSVLAVYQWRPLDCLED